MGEKTFRFLSRFSLYVSGLVIAFGVMVLVGWTFHIQRLKGLIPGQVSVKANTGVCFLLIGTALWLAISETRKRSTIMLARVLALMAGLVGLLSFLEFWRGWDFGIDQLLFRAGPDDVPGSVRIGLMSPISAAGFLLLGISVALLNVRGRWSLVLQRTCCVIAAAAAVFGVLDFVLDPLKTHTHIAPLTALILFLCSFAVLCARLEGGLGALVVSGTVGGLLCRRLLPSAILIPIGIAWLQWKGQQMGLFSDWTGLAIMTLSSGVFLAGLTVWTAIALDRIEEGRERAEESSRCLAAIVISSSDAIIGETLDGIVTSWNPGAEAIYGYSAEEMIGQPVTRLIPAERMEEFEALLQRVRKGENIRHHETERTRKDGRAISVAVSISPLKDASGEITGASTIARDISDQKVAEQALANERRRFEAVLDSLPVMICLLRPDYSMAFANRSFRKQFGEAQGRKCYEFCFGKTAPCEFCHSFDVLKNDRPTDWQVVTRDGRMIHAFDFLFTDSDGSPLVLEMDVDVTEQKEGEQKLREASRYTRSLIEASLDPLVTISKEGRITDVNEATEKTTGLSREGLIGSDFSSYFTEPQKAREGYERVFEKGLVRDYPLAIRSTAGVVTDVLYNATVFRGADGGVEGIFAAARDVTERKRAEEALHRSECRYRSLVTATAQIVWTTNREGEVVDDMPMWRAYTGMNRQQISGAGWLDSLHPDDRNQTEQVWAKAWRKRERYDTEYRIRGRDGEYRIFSVRGVPVLADDGTVREWVGTCTDITERKQAEEEVRNLNNELERRVVERTAQLESANKELEAFTYSVSHDLRAPLRHISGFSKILSEEFGDSLPPEALHHVQRIADGTRRMGQLVDDLLNLGRVGRRELTLQVAGIRSIVDEVIHGVKSEMGERKVEWKIGDLPYVECDTALMQQVFQNLLANALKFTRPRTQAVIEIGQERRDGRPVIYVRDNGVGFSMKYADKLFGVFQRLHRAEDFEGTGVGLATVQRIIQKHGGRIWAEAELDKGASFYFTLGNSQSSEENSKAGVAGANS